MKVFHEVVGFPKKHYVVKHEDWIAITTWLKQNEIEYTQESFSSSGWISFSIVDYNNAKGHEAFFRLKWCNA